MSKGNGARGASKPPLELVDVERQVSVNVPVVPPVDLGAEQSVLGALILANGQSVPGLLELGLEPEHFYYPSHGLIFEAAVALHHRGAGVDAVTLCAELKRRKLLGKDVAPATVEALAASPPVVQNVLDYGRVVVRTGGRRRLQSALIQAVDSDLSPASLAEVVEAIEAPEETSSLSRRRMDLVQIQEMAEKEPPWRCQDFVADGHVTTLVGRGGEGKSLLTLALAGAVQLGQTVAGIPCSPGKVVIFDAENGEWIMGSRMKAGQIPIHGLEIYNAEGFDLARHKVSVAKACEGAQLVIFDSLRTLAPGAKENDSDDMAPVMGAIRYVARTTGAAVIVIHHRGKDAADYRGSSSIRDQTDLMFVLDRDSRDPEQKWRRSIRCAKCRIAAEPTTRWIGIKYRKGELYLTEADAFDPEEHARPVRDELSEEIIALITEKGPATRGTLAKALDRDLRDATLKRALKDLLEDDVLLKANGHRYMLQPEGVSEDVTPADPPDPRPLQLVTDEGVTLKGNDPLTPSDAPAEGDGV